MNAEPSLRPTAHVGRHAPGQELLRVEDLHKHFAVPTSLPWQSKSLRAVNGVSLSLARGETLALVGESGCGKSTLGRTILGLYRATSGTAYLEGQDLFRLTGSERTTLRRDIQVVFQDPYASLDPRMCVGDIVAEPLRIQGRNEPGRVAEVLAQVGIGADAMERLPAQFSGGQRQRIAIARALILQPKLVILDEAVSALDVSIRAQVLNLLVRLQRELGVSFLFISHDLSVVHHIAHRVALMYLGKIVEIGTREAVFTRQAHPYTRALISAVPQPDPIRRGTGARIVLQGDLPSPVNPPSGCVFRTRCFRAASICAELEPQLAPNEDSDLFTACHFPMPRPGV